MMLVNGRRRVLEQVPRDRGPARLVRARRRQLGAARATYEIRLRAFDRAGNRSARTRAVTVRVRYVELVRDRVEVGRGHALLGRRLDRRGVVPLALRRARGKARRKRVLVLRAPETPGTYVLYVVRRAVRRPGRGRRHRARRQP